MKQGTAHVKLNDIFIPNSIIDMKMKIENLENCNNCNAVVSPFSPNLSSISQTRDLSPWKSIYSEFSTIEKEKHNEKKKKIHKNHKILTKVNSVSELKLKLRCKLVNENETHKKASSIQNCSKNDDYVNASKMQMNLVRAIGPTAARILNDVRNTKQNKTSSLYKNYNNKESNRKYSTNVENTYKRKISRERKLEQNNRKGKSLDKFGIRRAITDKNSKRLFSFPEEIVALDKDMIKILEYKPLIQ